MVALACLLISVLTNRGLATEMATLPGFDELMICSATSRARSICTNLET